MSDSHPRVVVGVDGSPASIRALRFAIDEARMRGAILQVLHTFASPTSLGLHVPSEYFETLDANAEHVVDNALREATDSSETDMPRLIRTVVAGNPVQALVDASGDATLLVLGSRGLGEFQSLLLGSVSSQCVHHAHCPVTIVR